MASESAASTATPATAGTTASPTPSPTAAAPTATAAPRPSISVVRPIVEEPVVQEEAERPPVKQIGAIVYIGTADVKRLEVADLERVGLSDVDEALEWNAANGYRLEVKSISADAADYFAQQPDFDFE